MKSSIITLIMTVACFISHSQNKTAALANEYFFSTGNFLSQSDEISIPPNASIPIIVKQITLNGSIDAVLEPGDVDQWTIDGKDYASQNSAEGNFKQAPLLPYKGEYKAPAQVPPHNPVVITVSFRPPGQKGKVILYCSIHIIDKENYFYLTNPGLSTGTLYELKESPIPSFRKSKETANYVNDQWNIMIFGFRKIENDNTSMQSMSISLSIVENATGSYPWTVHGDPEVTGLTPPCNTVTVTETGDDGSPHQFTSVECIPFGDDHCHFHALEGTTTVTVFDKKNKIIKGYFSGKLLSENMIYVPVSGAFSAFMQ